MYKPKLKIFIISVFLITICMIFLSSSLDARNSASSITLNQQSYISNQANDVDKDLIQINDKILSIIADCPNIIGIYNNDLCISTDDVLELISQYPEQTFLLISIDPAIKEIEISNGFFLYDKSATYGIAQGFYNQDSAICINNAFTFTNDGEIDKTYIYNTKEILFN